MPEKDVPNVTRTGPRDRLGEAITVSSPQREASCVLRKVRILKDTQTPYQTTPLGIADRTEGTRGARSRPCARTLVVDAALGIDQNDDSLKRRQFGT